MSPEVVAAVALELAADCLIFGIVLICQALVAVQDLLDGSVLQGTGLHVSKFLVSAVEPCTINKDIPWSARLVPQSSLP